LNNLPECVTRLLAERSAGQYRLSPLPGGLTNQSYRIDLDNSDWVLRIDAPHTAGLSLDRELESTIHVNAANAGIAPRIIMSEPSQGVLVREFVDGDVWSGADLASESNLRRLAQLLQRAHTLPLSGAQFNAVTLGGNYADALAAHSSLSATAAQCMEVIASTPAPTNWRCCHGDVVAQNIIDGDQLFLLDWEYACDNDPLFDLACVVAYHDLDSEQAEFLLQSYLGDLSESECQSARDRLVRQISLFDALQWLWFARREIDNPDASVRERLKVIGDRLS
jgi:thiamine kinase